MVNPAPLVECAPQNWGGIPFLLKILLVIDPMVSAFMALKGLFNVIKTCEDVAQ